jgi:hypothetical protein
MKNLTAGILDYFEDLILILTNTERRKQAVFVQQLNI